MDTAPAPPPPDGPVEHPAHGPAPRIPLRVTLVALMVALVAAGLTATGFAATSLLRDYLVEQQDEQLQRTLESFATQPYMVVQACSRGEMRFPSEQYIACLELGAEDSALSVATGPRDTDDLPDVSSLDAAAVEFDSPQIFTTTSEDGRTSWRVGATRAPATPVSDEFVIVLGSDLSADEDALSWLVRIELLVGLLVLAVLGVAGYLVVRNSLRPLTEVEDTARAIAAGDLSRRVPVGDDRTEVGRLSQALNGMLGRIESSFRAQQASEEHAVASEARMRRFVADASHELRTPLTSIRGFAELHRQGAVHGPEDTGRLMQRIESEATRMGLLVEDLLQLARLDQQRPLALGPVDLAELAGDAVHDAGAVTPDRSVSLQLDPSLTDVPVIRGDEARLRQVIGNLVTNALTHTPAGTRVTVRVAEDETEPDWLVLAVSDEGPGLAPADAERVFERFYRADASRTRAAGGTGLGLSIVAALVEAHGGRVELRTAPGEGATFAVHLPRSGPPGPPVSGPS